MINLIIEFFIVFSIIYFTYLINIFIKINKFKKDDPNVTFKTSDIMILISLFKLDIEKLDIIQTSFNIAFLNSFIISISYVIINLIDNIIYKILFGFLFVIFLVFISYFIMGKIYSMIQKSTK